MASKTWNGVSADWNIGADWTPAGVPAPLDTVLLGGTAGYIIGIGSVADNVLVAETEMVAGLTLADAAATLAINNGGELDIGGTLALVAGTIDLVGVLAGATIAENGGTIFGDRGTLNGVSLIGPAQLAGSSGQVLYIQNGLSLTGAGGTGPGTFSLTSASDQLGFVGTQTLANARINLSGNGERVSVQTLTLAATTTLVASGQNASIYGAAGYGAGMSLLTNAGTIIVAGTSAALAIDTNSLINDGLITVGAGDVLTLGRATGPLGGTGSIALAAGSTIVLAGSLTSAALMAEIAALVGAQPGVTIELAGTIDNTGATLDFTGGALAGGIIGAGADIIGGTVLAGATGPVIAGGTLDGVVYQGTLAIGGSLVNLTVADGITVQSAPGIAGTIAMTGNSNAISLVNTPTLDNVTFSESGAEQGIFDTGDSIFTLGANFVADIAGIGFVGATGTVVNYGAINATAPGSTFQFLANTIYNGGAVTVGVVAPPVNKAETADGSQRAAGGTLGSSLAQGFQIGIIIGLADVKTVVGSLVIDPSVPMILKLLDPTKKTSNAFAGQTSAAATTPSGQITFEPATGVELGSILETSGIPAIFSQFTNLPTGVVFGGTILNADATLDITATGSLSTVVIAGEVDGGTILEDGGVLGFAQTSVLNGVTLVGSLDVSGNPSTAVVLTNSTITSADGGPAVIAINGTADKVTIFGQTIAQTLTATQISLGIASGATGDVFGQVGGTLILGAGVTLAAGGTSDIYLNSSNGYNSTAGNATLTNAGVITDSGNLTIGTYGNANGAAVFVNTGMIAVGAGGGPSVLSLNGSVANAGTISVTGTQTLQVLSASFANTGLISLATGATAIFQSDLAVAGTIAMLDGAETLDVKGSGMFAATIEDFSAGDTVDFTTVPFIGLLAPTATLAGDVLNVFQGPLQIAALTLPSLPYTQTSFALASDQRGGTRLTTSQVLPCFLRGTRLRGSDGEIAVEDIRPGDRLLTATGAVRPVAWVGHRWLDCRTHAQPEQVLPVRIRADAIAEGLPSRDLFLSPDHSLFLDGVLIPAKHLINGRSIAQIAAASVEYWHVELDSHDVLLAETLPCESYLDTGNRHDFAEGGTVIALHPDFAARSWNDACAELVQDGPRLVAAKQRIFERAGPGADRPIALRAMARGRSLVPEIGRPGLWRYRLPAGTRTLRLLSPAWSPAARYGSSLDRRRLGVRLLGVEIDGVATPFSAPVFGTGFHPAETTAEGTSRWTDGDALLRLPSGASIVTLAVGDDAVATGPDMRAA